MNQGADPQVGEAEASKPWRPTPFRPPWWLKGRHAQTLAGKLLKAKPKLVLHRERVDTPDGDFIDLDFMPEPRSPRPIVLVLHGLEGSARRSYVLTMLAALEAQGLWGVGLNFRSCSGEPNRTPRFYHSGETGDLAQVLGMLSQRFPGSPIGAVGFSLGGNALLKYLGEVGGSEGAPPRVAAAISVPFDLSAGARMLEAGFMGRLYTFYFMRMLRRKTRLKREILREAVDVDAVLRTKTLRAFDELATAPLHGFSGAEDYYARSSSAGFLDRIRVPTLLLHSLDDPFLPASAVPKDAVYRNPLLTGVFTQRGGHVGFIGGGRPLRPRPWAEEEAARFLAHHLRSTPGP
ncbi:MAG: hydrolase [Gemmatimonadota bacterium]|nr:MAG: hydrolase [Gemmatimonadota bacterium]